MLREISKQNLKSIGGKIQGFGSEIEELDPYSDGFSKKINELFNSIEKMVKVARKILEEEVSHDKP